MCLRLLQLANGSCNEQKKIKKIKNHIFGPQIVRKQCFCIDWIGLQNYNFLVRSDIFYDAKFPRNCAFHCYFEQAKVKHYTYVSMCDTKRSMTSLSIYIAQCGTFHSQIREQIGWTVKKRVGPIMRNFWGLFFKVSMDKILIKSFFENILESALKSGIE